MLVYSVLILAIAFEVIGTLLLPASKSFTRLGPTLTLLSCYAISFYSLSWLSQKLSLAVIYATWSGLGIVAVSILSFLLYQQRINWPVALGLVLIIIGVIVVNVFKPAIT